MRHLVRLFQRRPLFAGFLTVTLALGLGASTAMFSVLDGVLLRPLPYPAADRLLTIWQIYPNRRDRTESAVGWDRIPLSWDDYQTLKEQSRTIEVLGVYSTTPATVVRPSAPPEQLSVSKASASLLPLLGRRPVLGRWLSSDEEGPNAPAVALLSYDHWSRSWNADAGVLGQSVTIRGRVYSIIGVMPRDFELRLPNDRVKIDPPDIWIPIGTDPNSDFVSFSQDYDAIARVRAGVNPAAVADEVYALLKADRPPELYGARVEPRLIAETRAVRPTLSLLAIAVALLMLLTCANVAALLLGEAAAREGEMATRAALGAAPSRLIRQLLTEQLSLVSIAALLGVLLAHWMTRALLALAPVDLPHANRIGIDLRVVGFALAAALITAIAVGLTPALAARRAALAIGRGSGRVTQRTRFEYMLVSVQVMITVVLLVSAVTLVRTLLTQIRFDPGFKTESVLAIRVRTSSAPNNAAMRAAVDEQLRRVRALPGITGATVMTVMPYREAGNLWSISLEPNAPFTPQSPSATRITVWPDAFQQLGMRIVDGRALNASDNEPTARNLAVNEAFVRRFFPAQSAIGRTFKTPVGVFTIVGVVADARIEKLEIAPEATFYLPYAPNASSRLTFLVNTRTDPLASAEGVRNALRAVDPGLAVIETNTIENLIRETMADERYRTLLLLALSAIATLLAAIGIAGTTLRLFEQRRRELCVRMCVGASPSQAGGVLIGRAAYAIGFGLVVGAIATQPAGRILQSRIAGLGAADTQALLVSMLVVLIAGGIALINPLRRLFGADIARSLREV
jgi:predicted permease